MILNKWLLALMALILVLVGAALTFDWTTLFSTQTAGEIVAVLGLIKAVLAALMPSPNAKPDHTRESLLFTHYKE